METSSNVIFYGSYVLVSAQMSIDAALHWFGTLIANGRVSLIDAVILTQARYNFASHAVYQY